MTGKMPSECQCPAYITDLPIDETTFMTRLKDEIIGKESLDVEVIWEFLYNKARPFGQQGIALNALSGLDVTIWDLNGKQLGQPVSRLIGGRFREKLTAYATGFYRTPGGVYPEDAVKEAVGYGVMLMADFNACYSQADARRIMLELEPEKIYFWKEPLTPEDIDGYKALRNMTSSYIAAGEEIFGKIHIAKWLEAGALHFIASLPPAPMSATP